VYQNHLGVLKSVTCQISISGCEVQALLFVKDFIGDLDAMCMIERERFMGINGDLLFHCINIDN